MFKFDNLNIEENSLLPYDFIVNVNSVEIKTMRWIVSKLSNVIHDYMRKNPKSRTFILEIEEFNNTNMISDILRGKSITFTVNSIQFLYDFASILEINTLKNEITAIQDRLDEVEQNIRSSTEINTLISLEKILFSVKKFDLEKVASQIVEYPIENDVLSRFFLSACVGRPDSIELYIELILQIHDLQNKENLDSVIPIFCNMLITRLKKTFYYDEDKKIQQEMCFIIEKLIENELIEGKEIIYQRTPLFFSHILDSSLLRTMKYLERDTYSSNMLEAIDEDNFETHKKFIKIGKNMNKIALSIRNDDLDELQKSLFSSDYNFNFNGTIPNSVYERCSFVNLKVTYLEFAAFFGSVKCFKYLLLNGAQLTPNITKFAVGGGNNEVIRICEQRNCDFTDSVQYAIKYHQWEILKWLISIGKVDFEKTNEYITCCIFSNNYKSLMTLLKNGVDPSLVILESIRLNDLMLTSFLISLGDKIDLNIKDKKDKGLLQIACLSNNLEIVKILLNNTNIDINLRTFHNDGNRRIFIFLYFNYVFTFFSNFFDVSNFCFF